MKVTPDTTNRAMIRALLQGHVDPPHCKAKMRHMMDGIRKNVPGRSNCLTFSFHPRLCTVVVFGGRKTRMNKTAMPPNGRLM